MHLPTIGQARKRRILRIWFIVSMMPLLLPSAACAQNDRPGIAFSTIEPPTSLPTGWKNLPVAHGKAMTQYALVNDGDTTVLQADANRSASALMHEGNIDLGRTPVVTWRWKVEKSIASADNRVGSKEDAPARLVFLFDGDKSKLSFFDRAKMDLAKRLGGEELPYATLMYIWSTEVASLVRTVFWDF